MMKHALMILNTLCFNLDSAGCCSCKLWHVMKYIDKVINCELFVLLKQSMAKHNMKSALVNNRSLEKLS